MKRRPFSYLVRQKGLSEFNEIVRTKKKAKELAQDLRWWGTAITITPLYLGRPKRYK